MPNGRAGFGQNLPVIGNGYGIVVTNGSAERSLIGMTFGTNEYPMAFGKTTGLLPAQPEYDQGTFRQRNLLGLSRNPSKSGIIADLSNGLKAIIKY